MKARRVLGLAIALCWALGAQAATIYVDVSNAGAEDGLTPATAWNTIEEGLNHLAATNAVVQGGHTVLVAAGTYTEPQITSTKVPMITLDSTHAGTGGAPNRLLASGAVTLDASLRRYGVLANSGPSYFEIDGFGITGPYREGIFCNYAGRQDFKILNCDIYACGYGYPAVDLYNGTFEIVNCTIAFNGWHGISVNQDQAGGLCVVSNSHVAFNAFDGIFRNRGNLSVSYCNIYGNARAGYYDNVGDQGYTTQAEIDGVAGWSDNLAANPGFAGLSSWDFSVLYNNSPSLTGGPGGSVIGRYPSPTLVPVSSNTYYVAEDGDDGRTKAEATNPATPWATVAKAAANAVAGDTVLVTEGTYAGGVTVTMGSSHNLPVIYRGSGNAVISGGSDALRLSRTVEVRIEGLTLSGASGSGSAGLNIDQSCLTTVSNVVCSGNFYGINIRDGSFGNRILQSTMTASTRSGVYSYGYRDTFTGSTFSSNGRHGLTAQRADCVVEGCTINDNGSGYNGITLNYSCQDWSIRNCNIYANGGDGFWNRFGDNAIESCTIYGNTGHGIYFYDNSDMTVSNCNIVGNQGTGLYEGSANSDGFASYCNFYLNTASNYYDAAGASYANTEAEINGLAECSDNIVADPLFKDAPNDFRLAAGSPCIDAGSPTSTLVTDFYGNPRVQGEATDIGSYEFTPGITGTIGIIR
jgi:parallel beta-helix repeat protein